MTDGPPYDLAERTFRFACAIVRFCRRLAREPGVTRHIAWQLADAGTSIAANYEEAKAAYSRLEFAAKNAISLKECREAKFWLRLTESKSLGDPKKRARLLAESDQLIAILTTIVRTLQVGGKRQP